MAKKPHTNNTNQIQHIGTVTLWPGETREVEETLIPDHRPAPSAPAPEPDALAALIERNAPEVIAALPALDDDELALLDEMERAAEKPRKGVLQAIAEEQLLRADRAQAGEGETTG